ncbi:DNA polymerase I [Clostridiaceae bacterium 68-1-5]|uniref:DNA polymerase I n=1 Tax=Suipraeoptans intestinalis TaxID=2606628 RepID=A0A6N7V2S4_9FIRM|nr:DNA polymerase I [Suipraeoptans intestinalis]MSR94899.1 DNA polymerase I [Suipraeoptans intestinalis]
MKEKILLIDGHSILNRAFFGIPDLTNSEGLHTNGIYGFLMILFKILEEENPTHLTVAFDVHAPTFRHKMYEAYKGTRKPMAEELRQQVPVMKQVLQAMGIHIVEKEGLEADDVIGTLSRTCEDRGLEVTVLSGDRDLLQLATESIKIRIPKTKGGKTEVEDYYAKDVQERYQVTPEEFVDMKALMGDTSDNIPGVPGIGEKTAAKLIGKYHNIETAWEHRQEIRPERIANLLTENWEQALLSKRLAAICTEAELAFAPEDARMGDLYTKEAYALFQRLQFKNLLSRFDLPHEETDLEAGFVRLTGKQEAEELFQKAFQSDRVGVVIQKDAINDLPLFAGRKEIAGIGLCFSDDQTYYIEIGKEMEKSWAMDRLRKLSGETKSLAMFDIKENLPDFFPKKQEVCFDLMVAAYLLDPLKSRYSLEEIGREYLELLYEEEKEEGRKWITCCHDAFVAYQAVPVLQDRLKKEQMEELFRKIEMPLVFTLYDMEQNGVKIAAKELKEYGEKLAGKIRQLEEEIYEEAGEKFNINSPKQLGVILFEHMRIPGGRKTKTGYSTAADVLEKLALDYPFVNKILEYRQYAKLKSTYADGLAAFIREDGRIHGKFNQTIAATGRLSSTEPNLQNIPVRMELGRMIRKAFIPEQGFVFVDADYSQIELRILAHCSEDEHLIAAYKEAKDIHRATASQVFGVPFEEVTEELRRNAKAVNFGIVYGISSFGLSQDLSITRKEADAYIKGYFKTYPGIKRFLDDCVSQAKEKGYAVTLLGRRRPVPELTSKNFAQRNFGERVAMNAPIQGAAADIMKIAMIGVNTRLKEEGLRSRLVLQVHDELLIETKEEEVETVKRILEEEMGQAVSLRVPLEIDINVGDNWYEAK